MAIEILKALLKTPAKKGVAGIWSDDKKMIAAAHKVREAGYKKFDAITPFPMHEVDEAVGIPRSFIPFVTFIMGLIGCLFGVWLTWWVSAIDWPLNVGGKPMWSLPAFIPVIFECTILFAALSSVGMLLFKTVKFFPEKIDPSLTSHKFAIFVPEDDVGYDSAQLQKLFQNMGADEVKQTEF